MVIFTAFLIPQLGYIPTLHSLLAELKHTTGLLTPPTIKTLNITLNISDEQVHQMWLQLCGVQTVQATEMLRKDLSVIVGLWHQCRCMHSLEEFKITLSILRYQQMEFMQSNFGHLVFPFISW